MKTTRKKACLKVARLLSRGLEKNFKMFSQRLALQQKALKIAYSLPDNIFDIPREYSEMRRKIEWRWKRRIIRRRSLHDYDERETLAIHRYLRSKRKEDRAAARAANNKEVK